MQTSQAGLAPAPPETAARRARAGVGVLFLTNGAIFANLLPRYPEIKADLELSNTAFGLAVAAFPMGALIAGLTAGMLVRRFRSSRVAVAATFLTALCMLLAGTAPAWSMLAAALFLAGAMDSITDVAQNSHGLRVQRLYKRSIINSLHAVWSVGAVTGGLLGSAAAGLDIPRGLHLSLSGALFSVLALVCYRLLLAGPEPLEHDNEEPAPVRDGSVRSAVRGSAAKYGVLAALILIAASGAFVEEAGSSWSALYLSASLGASAFVAGLGFIALQGMQFIGRITGDRLVDRFGERSVARAGGVVVFLGMGTALALPTLVGTVVGFGLAGLGVATLIPAAMHAADQLPGLKPGTGLTIVSWLLRLGFLLSAPLIGLVADLSSIRYGLLAVPAAGLLVVLFAPVLSSKTRS